MSLLEPSAQSESTANQAASQFDWSRLLLASIGTVIAVGLNIATRRGVPLVGWDGFNYLGEARHLAKHLPDHVGGIYPYGYPFIAALFIRGGASAYVALISVSAATYWLLLYLLASTIKESPNTRRFRLLVPALSFVPVLFFLAVDVDSDMTFAAIVLGAAIMLTRWRRVPLIYATVLVFVLAFAVRYAGLFLIPVAVLWLAYDRWTEKAIPFKHAAVAIVATTAADLALIWSNIVATGFASGGPRAAADRTFAGILFHCADFGLGPIADLSSGAFSIVTANVAVHMILGLAGLAAILWLATRSLRKRRVDLSTAAAVIVVAYAASIIALQSRSYAADPARFFVPVIAPLFIVVASQIEIARARAAAVGAVAGIAAVGIVTAIRGISPETYGGVASAARYLSGRLTPGMRIFVNANATSLAASIDADMFMVVAGPKLPDSYIVDFSDISARKGDYLVIASIGTGRSSSSRSFPARWVSYLQSLEQSGGVSTVLQNQDVIVARYER